MKELKLLPEDWKGEIDYSQVKMASYILNDEIKTMWEPRGESLKTIQFNRACPTIYRQEGVRLVAIDGDLPSEPRPADSIMLSECGSNHLIECTDENNRLHYVTHNNCLSSTPKTWIVTDMLGNMQCHGDLVRMMMQFDSVRVYDMTK